MRAFIQAFKGKTWNEECETALNGFEKLGIECILFSTTDELEKRNPEDIVVGGMLMMAHVFAQDGITLPNYNYPKELEKYLGRRIWTVKCKDLYKEQLPIFIKPVKEKAAKGVVVRSWEDAEDYKMLDPESEIICSDVVNFVSEWRCFIWYGRIVGIQNYFGNSDVRCDYTVLNAAVIDYGNMPSGCSLDFGVTDDGRTLLIEMNDGFAIGCYGLQDTSYAKLLSARWAEITGNLDPFWINPKWNRSQLVFIGNYEEISPKRGYPFMRDSFCENPYPGQGRVIYYLLHGEKDMCSFSDKNDIFTGERIENGNLWMNDGEYVWPLTMAHYVKRYNLRLPEAFEKKILSHKIKKDNE